MIDFKSNNYNFNQNRRMNFLVPIAILWGLIIAAILGFYWFENIYDKPNSNLYLFPWCLMTGIVIAAPSVYLYYKKKFNLFHPLVFAGWFFFFPSFFIGGLILTSGLSNPIFLYLVQDERYYLPLTFVYVMLGYGGLSIGFFLPFGRKLGEIINNRLPKAEWQPEKLLKPALILLVIGIGNTILGFSMGVLGFQRVDEIGVFDGLVFLLSMFWIEASFLIWLCVFRTKKLNYEMYFVIAVVLITFLTKSAFQGNRGSLIQIFILITCAFVLSGKKILFKHKAIGAGMLLVALSVGMIYGTTFRSIKLTEEKISMDQYVSIIFQTFDKLSDQDMGNVLETGIAAFGERIENVSPFAVVVSNYEKLSSYEASYGLDNNIWKDTLTFLIPRILWEDKPVATDSYKYGDLYFHYDKNSFTLTPMGDLLRNFGPIGVPLGMIFLGFVLRIIWATLIENQDFSFWRTVLYYVLLTNLYYEGSYGLIIPFWIKVGGTTILGLLIIYFVKSLLNPQPRGLARQV